MILRGLVGFAIFLAVAGCHVQARPWIINEIEAQSKHIDYSPSLAVEFDRPIVSRCDAKEAFSKFLDLNGQRIGANQAEWSDVQESNKCFYVIMKEYGGEIVIYAMKGQKNVYYFCPR